MSFGLYYVRSFQRAPDQELLFASMLRNASGEVFYIETELVVFHQSSQAASHPLYAATLSGLQYVQRSGTSDREPGFKVSGKLPDGKKFELWAGEAQTFYDERGLVVFYERPDRSGRQTLAVRCSAVDEIRWLEAGPQAGPPPGPTRPSPRHLPRAPIIPARVLEQP